MPEAASDSTGFASVLHSTIMSAEEWPSWTFPTTLRLYTSPQGCLQVVQPVGGKGKILLASHWKGQCSLTRSCDFTSSFLAVHKTGHVGITSAIHRLLSAVFCAAGST